MVLGVDLAAVLSASVVLEDGGAVVSQADSLTAGSPRSFVGEVVGQVEAFSPAVVAVEDLPHALPFMGGVKLTCRLQGRLLECLDRIGALDSVLFVPPACWQRHFEGVWRAGKAMSGTVAAERYGYHVPDMLDQQLLAGLHGPARSTYRAKLLKVQTDYVDAFLIARWALDMWESSGTYDVPSTQRVGG